VEGESEDDLADFFGQTYLKAVLGSKKFLSALVAKGKGAPKRQAKAQGMLPSLAVITKAVSTALDVPVKQFRQAVRGRGQKNEARWLAVCLCRDLGGYPLAEIAAYFGMGHISGIHRCVEKLGQARESDPLSGSCKKGIKSTSDTLKNLTS